MADIDREATREALRRLGQPDVLGNDLPPVEDISKDFTPEPRQVAADTAARAADIAKPRTADPLSKNFESDLAAEGSLSAATSDPALVRTAAAADPSTDPSLAAVAPVQDDRTKQPSYSDTAQAAQAPSRKPTAVELMLQDDARPTAAPAAEPPPPAPVAPRPAATPKPATQAAPGVTVVVQQPSVAEPKPGQTPTDDQLLAAGGKGANAAPAPSAPAPQGAAPAIETLPINTSASSGRLRGEVAAGVARGGELKGESVENVEQLERGQQFQEALRHGTSQQLIEGQVAREEDRKARYEESRAEFQAEREALKKKMGTPPANTVGIVMGLVSALAAAHGKQGMANAMAALGQQMNSPMRRWQAEIEAGQTNLEGMGKLVNMDRLAAADESTQQEMISKAFAAEMDAGFDALIRDAKTDDERIKRTEARNQYRMMADQSELNLRAQREQAALRARAMREMQAASASGDPARIAAARQKYGELGEQVRQVGTKTDQGLLNLDKTEAGILADKAKAANDAAEAAAKDPNRDITGNGVLTGWTATKKLPPGAEVGIVNDARLFGSIEALVNRQMNLAREIKKNGKDWLLKDPNAQKEINDIRTMKASLRNQASGAGSPTGDEFVRQFDNDVDPQQLFTREDALEVLARQDKNNKRIYETGIRKVGYMPDSEYIELRARGQAPRAPAPGGLVEMVDPDGKVGRYDAQTASALEKTSGFKRAQ